MAELSNSVPHRLGRRALVHSARTAVAAVVSLVVARGLALPEAYWATITTLIIMQSTLGAALTVSEQRLAGTALGAAISGVADDLFRVQHGCVRAGCIRHWIDLRRAASRRGVPTGQRHPRDCDVDRTNETGVDRRRSPLRRSRGRDRRGTSADRRVAGRRTHGD